MFWLLLYCMGRSYLLFKWFIYRRLIYIAFGGILCLSVNGQSVYTHVSNKGVYEFMDEMANIKLIELNSAIKPYSRLFIAKKLNEVELYSDRLNKRQLYELNFYLKDFDRRSVLKESILKRANLFYCRDSLFSLSVNPILGIQYWSNENGTNYHRWNGAEVFAYIGKHVGVYANLRDNHEERMIADTGYLNKYKGGNYKAEYDYSEMRGGITFSWKWGTLGVLKDHIEWGSGYCQPNIISSKSPSFAHLKLNLKPVKWFEFNYIHGWLVSEVVDSSRSYNYNGIQRDIFHGKWIAANMFSFMPLKNAWISFGNSIIYSDINVHPAYLIPVFFYKSVDHTYNAAGVKAGQNSQLFLDVNVRSVKYLSIYYSMFVDELSFERMFDEKRQSNHWSMKWGMRLSGLIPNTVITNEYTRNNALVYKNDDITTLYNSNWYTLGHYLGDNADEICLSVKIKPFRTVSLRTWFSSARKGPDYPYDRKKDPNTGILNVHGKPFMESVDWKRRIIGANLNYQIKNNINMFIQVEMSSVTGNQKRYTSPFYYYNTTTYSFGLYWGL